MNTQKELKKFMEKKVREQQGEIDKEKENNEIEVAEREKAINRIEGGENIRAAQALARIRLILNVLCIIPIILAIIGLCGYMLIRFIPSALLFLKRLIKILALS